MSSRVSRQFEWIRSTKSLPSSATMLRRSKIMKPLRKAYVMFKDVMAGVIEETDKGCRFTYDPAYLTQGKPIGVTFPLRERPYENKALFPFFKGLLPEGWFREIVCQTL